MDSASPRDLRWRERRGVFRLPHEVFRPGAYDVAAVSDSAAKAFVVAQHYSACYVAARFRFGLYHHGDLVGVAVFSHPTNDRVLTNVFGGCPTDSVELGRFVLLDQVAFNGESWFLGRCLRFLHKQGVQGVVSFSDPVPRTTADGRLVFPGHVGTIYQAGNATYLGRGRPRTLRLLPDGTVFSDRAIQKVPSREQGWEYASAQLVKFGANPLGAEDDGRAWLARWLPLLTRPMTHPGNHRYAWALAGGPLVSTSPYPKKSVAQVCSSTGTGVRAPPP
jgi:hypothetical protein